MELKWKKRSSLQVIDAQRASTYLGRIFAFGFEGAKAKGANASPAWQLSDSFEAGARHRVLARPVSCSGVLLSSNDNNSVLQHQQKRLNRRR